MSTGGECSLLLCLLEGRACADRAFCPCLIRRHSLLGVRFWASQRLLENAFKRVVSYWQGARLVWRSGTNSFTRGPSLCLSMSCVCMPVY